MREKHRRAGAPSAGLLFVLPSISIALLCAPVWAAGGSVSVDEPAYRREPLKEAPSEKVAKDVRKLLEEQGHRVLGPSGKPFVDIWLRKSVPVQEDPNMLGRDFGSVKDGTLLGVIRFHERTEDFRGNRFGAGLCTFRYAIRPVDGDHQGTSDTLDFVLLCPVDLDVKPDPMPTDKVVELSVEVSGRKHPSILYLLKMFDKPEKLPRVVEQEEKEYWVFDFQIPAEGKSEKDAVRMGLVILGLAPEF